MGGLAERRKYNDCEYGFVEILLANRNGLARRNSDTCGSSKLNAARFFRSKPCFL